MGFVTYAIKSPHGSGIISLNGSAARGASVGDLAILAAIGLIHEVQVGECEPQLVFPDARNRIVEVCNLPAGPQAGDPPI